MMARSERRSARGEAGDARLAVAVLLSCTLVGVILGAPPATAKEPLAVALTTVASNTAAETFEVTGEIASRDEARVSFREGGRVTRVAVEEGDHVESGAVLAEIDSTQQDQRLLSAEAKLEAAEATLEQARSTDARQAALLARGFTTRADRGEARDALTSAESAVDGARADVERARTAVADTVLRAPFDAVVTDKVAEVGQVIGAAELALRLAPEGRLDALFDIPDSLFTGSNDLGAVALRLIDPPYTTMTGHVREVSPLVNPQTGAIRVRVAVKDAPKWVQIGAPVRGIVTREARPVVRLPWTALTADDAGPAVWVVDEAMTVSLRPVEVGRYEDGSFTVSAGLEPGETVVGKGANLLYPGRTVQQVEPAP